MLSSRHILVTVRWKCGTVHVLVCSYTHCNPYVLRHFAVDSTSLHSHLYLLNNYLFINLGKMSRRPHGAASLAPIVPRVVAQQLAVYQKPEEDEEDFRKQQTELCFVIREPAFFPFALQAASAERSGPSCQTPSCSDFKLGSWLFICIQCLGTIIIRSTTSWSLSHTLFQIHLFVS